MEFNILGLLQPYKAKDNCLKIYSHVYFLKLFYFGLEGLNLQDRTLPAHRGSGSATVLLLFSHGLLR